MFRWQRIILTILSVLTFFLSQLGQAFAYSDEYPYCEGNTQPAKPLQYDPVLNKWSFTGTVTEIRHIHAIGMPAQVAYIQSAGFNAWVFQSFETDIRTQPMLRLGRARVGEQVKVSISGAHVIGNQVNWDLCEPRFSLYCKYGWLYDAGPYSPDLGAMVSPSNEFIHFRHPNPSWEQALYWNTERLKSDNPPERRSRRDCPV